MSLFYLFSRSNELEGKAAISTRTASSVFGLLTDAGVMCALQWYHIYNTMHDVVQSLGFL